MNTPSGTFDAVPLEVLFPDAGVADLDRIRRSAHEIDGVQVSGKPQVWQWFSQHVTYPGRAKAGTPDLHVLNSTGRPVHHGDVVVLVTNGRFTTKAIDFARSQQLHLVDRHLLARWAVGSTLLWELLSALPSPRRPSPGS
ncbi:restriction endonuclease [Streptomyces sp. bgisy126]|uniref:restriction endonuclease n=1 Tax=unclassified Streptomyces TaxID=2593676 RepID=UPI003EB883E8